jgi:hypothetical protein
MRRYLADIIVALAAVISGAVLLFLQPEIVWVRSALGIPLVVLLPGAALASFADREYRLGALEWLTTSVAASISLTILIAMTLAASIGLTTDALVTALVAITLALIIAAQLPPSPQPADDGGRRHQHRVTHLALGVALLLAFSFLIVQLSIPRIAPPSAGVVQLWGFSDNAGGLRIGARNVDANQERYVLTVKQGDQLITQQQVVLQKGASHIFEVKKSAIWTTNSPVFAELADESGSLPPRSISVWTVQ